MIASKVKFANFPAKLLHSLSAIRYLVSSKRIIKPFSDANHVHNALTRGDMSMNIESKTHPALGGSMSKEEYEAKYQQSIRDPEAFWDSQAKSFLDWFVPYKSVVGGSLKQGDYHWFNGGQLNACYNCIDKHAKQNPDKTAIIWESDEPGTGTSLYTGS
jgi:hypothetical protein